MDYDMNRWRKLVIDDGTRSNPWSMNCLVRIQEIQKNRGNMRDLKSR